MAVALAQKRGEYLFEARFLWFKEHISNGVKIREEEAQQLADITEQWEVQDLTKLAADAFILTQNPEIIWENAICNTNIIRQCFDGLAVSKNSIRDGILQMTLHEEVEKQVRLEEEPRQLPKILRSKTLRRISIELSPDKESVNRTQSELVRHSNAGKKWTRLRHLGYIISQADASTSKFSRGRSLTSMQYNFLNDWLETTKQFQIIDRLNEAFYSVRNHYRHNILLQRVDPIISNKGTTDLTSVNGSNVDEIHQRNPKRSYLGLTQPTQKFSPARFQQSAPIALLLNPQTPSAGHLPKLVDEHATKILPFPETLYSLSHLPFLTLLCALGSHDIPRDVLFCGLGPKKRWDSYGRVYYVLLQDSGLHSDIAQVFSDQILLENSISSCERLGFISEFENSISASNQARDLVSQYSDHRSLNFLGLLFTTHVFPQDEILEPLQCGKTLLPYIEHVWDNVQKDPFFNVPAPTCIRLIEASLAACRFAPVSLKRKIISHIESLQDLQLPGHLQLAVAYQKSVFLRWKDEHLQSDEIIRGVLGKVNVNVEDTRVHCAYGLLQLSRTENAIMRAEFDIAESYLASWEIQNCPGFEFRDQTPSGLELHVLRLKTTVHGRLARYSGDFKLAHYLLEKCLNIIPGNTSRCHIIHHLADVLCELNEPEQAQNLVQQEAQLRSNRPTKSFRRLVLPLAEAYIMQKRAEDARSILEELRLFYKGATSLDVSDQLGHVRSTIGLARIYSDEGEWLKSREALEYALRLTEKYSTFKKDGFYIGLIQLFLALVNFQLKDDHRALRSFTLAQDIRIKEKLQHFIPGLGTYVLARIKSEVVHNLVRTNVMMDNYLGHW